MARWKEPVIPDALLDRLLGGVDAKTAFDGGGLIDQLKKALAERALNAEMDHHLSSDASSGNSRNGYGKKTVLTEDGSLELSIPRDRQCSWTVLKTWPDGCDFDSMAPLMVGNRRDAGPTWIF